MKLRKKKTLSEWVKIDDTVKIKIDYPTIRQEQQLQTIVNSDEYKGNDKMLKWAQYLIKYTVKDWQGIDEQCKLITKTIDGETSTELDNELWWALVSAEENALTLASAIWQEIEFTETDKKK